MMQPIFVFRGHNTDVYSVYPLDDYLFSGDISGNIIIWDIAIRRKIYVFNAIENDSILNIHVYHHDKILQQTQQVYYIITQGKKGLIRQWKWDTSKQNEITLLFDIQTNTISFMRCYLLRYNQYHLLSSIDNDNKHIMLLDMNKKGQMQYKIALNLEKMGMIMCNKLMKTNDNQLLVLLGTESGNLILINVLTNEILLNEQMTKESILCIATLHVDVIKKSIHGFCAGASNKLCRFKISIETDSKVTDKPNTAYEHNLNSVSSSSSIFSQIINLNLLLKKIKLSISLIS